ncbi:MAG: NAD(P)/FAD-dependent oxidoreductase [Bacteroidia bacterium]|nr:NAD(P)/FAD-dependent oxidoreductase [Bacteroidia bacterium]
MSEKSSHFDVIIVGAGLSGIGAAHHLQKKCPGRPYAILEARSSMGGTWDLFQYPGIRSDSDMYTLGYSFKPWENAKAIADGPSILQYIKDTASEGGIDQNIHYDHKVDKMEWSSEDSKWHVETQVGGNGTRARYSCNFLFMCSGYYSYASGYLPDFENMESFKGQIVHPQKWTNDIEYEGKQVVVIGSGATAVTLVPELAKKTAHVIMLQRSPSYVMNMPEQDKVANFLRKILPSKVAYWFSRWKNILFGLFFYKLCRKYPQALKKFMMNLIKKEVGDTVDVDTHFNPNYKPWDQRLCAVPDNDLFISLKKGTSSIVTDHIVRFTERGLLLKSGKELEADLIVTATGLKMEFLANVEMKIDGKEIDLSELLIYRGMMFSNVPNLAQFVGYTNASWTLKADLSSVYACRLLNHMKKNGATICTPRITRDIGREPIIDFNSGYVLRAIDQLPKQGTEKPWKLHQNYILDTFNFRYSSLKNPELEFK